MSTAVDRNESPRTLVFAQPKIDPPPCLGVTAEKICVTETPAKTEETELSGDETESISESSESQETMKDYSFEETNGSEEIPSMAPTFDDDTSSSFETNSLQSVDHAPISNETRRNLCKRIHFATGEPNNTKETRPAHRPLGRSLTVPADLAREPTLKSCLKRDKTLSQSMGALDHDKSFSHPSNHVKFNKIIIREYEVTVGDNPSVSTGPPISLDWNVQCEHELEVESYEGHRGYRRHRDELRLPRMQREMMLHSEWEVPPSKIREARTQAQKSKVRRIHACKFMFADGAMLAMEETGKKLRRLVCGRSKEEKELRKWEKAHSEALPQ